MREGSGRRARRFGRRNLIPEARDISFASTAVQPLSLVMPLASVWEILRVKLQQALHFRPLQNLSTGYLSVPMAQLRSNPRTPLRGGVRVASFVPAHLDAAEGVWKRVRTKCFIHATLSYGASLCQPTDIASRSKGRL